MRLYSASSLFSALRQWFGETEPDTCPAADPIDHPDIASMSLLELADLPLRVERCECTCRPGSDGRAQTDRQRDMFV
jgi:hypothetical protein